MNRVKSLVLLLLFFVPSASAQPPPPPDLARLQSLLQSPRRSDRFHALRLLSSSLPDQAFPLLLKAAQHPDPWTRWWAFSALRHRSDPSLQTLRKSALRDPDERVRLLASLSLFLSSPPDRPLLLPLLKDPSLFVRDALCRSFLSSLSPLALSAFETCSLDPSLPLRDSFLTAAKSLLLPPASDPTLASLQSRLQTFLSRLSASSSLDPSNLASLRSRFQHSLLHQLPTYRSLSSQWLKFLSDNPNAPPHYASCLRSSALSLARDASLYETLLKRFLLPSSSPPPELVSNLLLLSRKLPILQQTGYRCQSAIHNLTYRYSRRPYRYPTYGPNLYDYILFEHLPPFYYNSERNRVSLGFGLHYDSFINLARDDLSLPAVFQKHNAIPARWDIPLQAFFDLRHNARITPYLLIDNEIRFRLFLFFLSPEPFGGEIFLLSRLSFARRDSSRSFHFALELSNALQSPSLPDSFPSLLHFNGLALEQAVKLSYGHEWKHKRRSSSILQLALQLGWQVPTTSLFLEDIWGMLLRSSLFLSYDFVFRNARFGFQQSIDFLRPLQPTPQLSSLRSSSVARFLLGDPFQGMSLLLQAGVGFSFLLPAPYESLPSDFFLPGKGSSPPTPLATATLRFQPSPTSRLPFFWSFGYEHLLQLSSRPRLPYASEHRLHAEIGISPPLVLLPYRPQPTRFFIRFHASFFSLPNLIYQGTFPDPLSLSPMRVLLAAELPFQRWSVQSGVFVDFIRQPTHLYLKYDENKTLSLREDFLSRVGVYLHATYTFPL